MKTPLHLWIFGTLALFWNLIGATDYTLTQFRFPSYMAQFSPEQLNWFDTFPSWAQACWAFAVWFSLLASVLLLLRKGAAVMCFALSTIAMLLTELYNFVLAPVRLDQISGTGALWFSAFIALVCIVEWIYTRWLRQSGVIR